MFHYIPKSDNRLLRTYANPIALLYNIIRRSLRKPTLTQRYRINDMLPIKTWDSSDASTSTR